MGCKETLRGLRCPLSHLGKSLGLGDLVRGEDLHLLPLHHHGVEVRVLPVVGQHGVRQPSQGLRLRDVDVQQSAVKVRDETENRLRSEILLFMFSPQLVSP